MQASGRESLCLSFHFGDSDQPRSLETEREQQGFKIFKVPISPVMSYIPQFNRLYLVERQFSLYIREVEVNLNLMGAFRTVQISNFLYLSTCTLPHLDSFIQLNQLGDLTKLRQLNVSRSAHSLCGNSSFILATGGIRNYVEIKECQIFNVEARRWKCKTPLIKAEAFHGSVVVDQSQVYLFGGTNSQYLRIQKYMLCTNEWSSCILRNIEKLFFISCLQADNRIVVFNQIEREYAQMGFKLYHFSSDEVNLVGMYECAPIHQKLPVQGLSMFDYICLVDQSQEMCLLREKDLDLRFKLQFK